MQKRIIKSINPFVRTLSFIIFLFSIVVAKTIPSFIVITLLFIIMIILNNENVKEYVNYLKRSIFLLLLITIVYIIIVGYCNLLIFIYKLLLLMIIIYIMFRNYDFNELDYSINKLVKPLKIFKINVDKLSFSITLNLFFIKYYFEKDKTNWNINKLNPKHFIEKIMYVDENVKKLQLSLKLKFYKINKYSITLKDILILSIFIVVFIATIYKEVIM